MKLSELISSHYRAIAETMKEEYQHILECDGAFKVQIYIRDNGEIATNEVSESNTWLCGSELHHVCTIGYNGCFDYRDYITDSVEDDEEEEIRQEVIEYLTDAYDSEEHLDRIIEELEREEK